MKDIIKEIQEEINQLMSSKYAKFSDKQLENWAKNQTSIEKVLEMYQLHLSGMPIAQIAKKYGHTSSNKVTDKFDRHGLKYKNLYHKGGKHNNKPIEQYSLDGDYIQTFESVSSAAKHFKCHQSSILGAANGRQKTSCGFIWKYKN